MRNKEKMLGENQQKTLRHSSLDSHIYTPQALANFIKLISPDWLYYLNKIARNIAISVGAVVRMQKVPARSNTPIAMLAPPRSFQGKNLRKSFRFSQYIKPSKPKPKAMTTTITKYGFIRSPYPLQEPRRIRVAWHDPKLILETTPVLRYLQAVLAYKKVLLRELSLIRP